MKTFNFKQQPTTKENNMKNKITKVTIQFALTSDPKAFRETNVERRVNQLNEFADNQIKLEVEDANIKVVESDPNSIVTHKYKANSVAELINNLFKSHPYCIMLLMSDYGIPIGVQATDEEQVEVEDE